MKSASLIGLLLLVGAIGTVSAIDIYPVANYQAIICDGTHTGSDHIVAFYAPSNVYVDWHGRVYYSWYPDEALAFITVSAGTKVTFTGTRVIHTMHNSIYRGVVAVVYDSQWGKGNSYWVDP